MSSPRSPSENRPLDQLKVTELKDELRKRGLSLKGVKKELCERLEEAMRKEDVSPYGGPKLTDEQEQVLGITDTEGNMEAEGDQHKDEEDAVIATKDEPTIGNVPVAMEDPHQNTKVLEPTCEDVECEKGVDSMLTANDDARSCCQGQGMSTVTIDSSGLNSGTFEQEFAGNQGGDVGASNAAQVFQDDPTGQSNAEAQHSVLPITEVTAPGLHEPILIEESNAIKSGICGDPQVEEAEVPMPENLQQQDVHDETCDTSQSHISENIAQASQSDGVLQSVRCPNGVEDEKPLAECAISSIEESKVEQTRGDVDAEMLTIGVPMESVVCEGMEIESKPDDSATRDGVEECPISNYTSIVKEEVEDLKSFVLKREAVVEPMKVELDEPDAMIKPEELEVMDKKVELVKFEEALERPWIIARESEEIKTEDSSDFKGGEDDSRVGRSGSFLKEGRRNAERWDAKRSFRHSELEKYSQTSSKVESVMEDCQRLGYADDVKEVRRDAEWRESKKSFRQSELEKYRQASSRFETIMEDRQRSGHADDVKEEVGRDAERSFRQSELEKYRQASSRVESTMDDRQRSGHADDIKEMDSCHFESRKHKEDASMPDREIRHQYSMKRQRRWNSGNSSSGPKALPTDIVKEIAHSDDKDSVSFIVKPETKILPLPKCTPVAAKGELASNGDVTKPRIVPPSKCPPTTSLKINKFVRPFTLKAVKELLAEFGTCVNFWMDQIKTHCYVTFSKVDEAVAARDGLYNRQWPPSFGNVLVAEFVDPQEVKNRSEGGLDAQVAPPGPRAGPPYSHPPGGLLHAVPPPPPLRERQLPPPLEKEPEPVVTLDDLFRKTEAKPHIYYLPLTGEQVKMKLEALKNKQSVRP